MEVQRSTGLDKPVVGLVGWRPVIQITAQMRVLVAIEAVDIATAARDLLGV